MEMVEHARALRRKRDDAGMESQAGNQSRDGSKSSDGPAAMRLQLAEESCSARARNPARDCVNMCQVQVRSLAAVVYCSTVISMSPCYAGAWVIAI